MKRIAIIIMCCCFLCCIFSCAPATKTKNKVYLILFDISISVKQDEMLKAYSRDFELIESKIKPGDMLVAGLISEKSISELALPINYKFGEFEASVDNKLYEDAEKKEFEEKQKAIKDSIKTVIDTLLHSTRISDYTDIFSSLQLAEKIFKSYMDYQKVLVIMSDMVESTKVWDFDKENLTEKRTKEIIDLKTKNGEVPDLKGVKVYVAGANYKTPEKFNQIQKFWLKYFEACKADLKANNYNSALINFDE